MDKYVYFKQGALIMAVTSIMCFVASISSGVFKVIFTLLTVLGVVMFIVWNVMYFKNKKYDKFINEHGHVLDTKCNPSSIKYILVSTVQSDNTMILYKIPNGLESGKVMSYYSHAVLDVCRCVVTKLKHFSSVDSGIVFAFSDERWILDGQIDVTSGKTLQLNDDQRRIINAALYNTAEYMNQVDNRTVMSIVQRDGMALRFIEKQTHKLCLEAVKQNGLALQYVLVQSEDICLAAYKQSKKAIDYVDEEFLGVCIKAADIESNISHSDIEIVRRDGMKLQFMQNQTSELCLEAVKQNGLALQFVKEQTEEICLAAYSQNKEALQFIKKEFIKSYKKPAQEVVVDNVEDGETIKKFDGLVSKLRN